jgi:hypothetical protein
MKIRSKLNKNTMVNVTYTEEQITLFHNLGIRLQKGKTVIPKGTIVLNDKTITLMAKSYYLIDPNITIESYASMIKQNTILFNKLICAHNITNGTKLYKKYWSYTLDIARGKCPTPLERISTGKVNKVPTDLHLLNKLVMDSKSFNHDRNYGNGKSFQILNSIYGTYLLANASPIFDVGQITKPLSKSSRINLNKICIEFREFIKKHPLKRDVNTDSIVRND